MQEGRETLHRNGAAATVLSLFDGIACGRLALQQAGIPVSRYYASEIDPCAIAIAKRNFPGITEIGAAERISFSQGILSAGCGRLKTGHISLLMGGSPCTDFSSIGNGKGMRSGGDEVTSLRQYLELKGRGAEFSGQSYLFWEYVRIMHETRPSYFLLENTVMPQKWKDIISSELGKPIKMNSSLISAQNRPRLYWTNIPGVCPPRDRGICLDGMLDPEAPDSDVSGALTVQRCFPRLMAKYGYIPRKFNAYNASEIKDKSPALSRGSMVTSSCAALIMQPSPDGPHLVRGGIMDGLYPVGPGISDGRHSIRKLSIKEMERLQTLPDGYTEAAGASGHKRGSAIGNGWTVDMVAHILSYMPC